MDVKAFPALIVGVVVALVLAGAVLPVFAETTSAETTFKNEGYFYLDKFTSEDSYSLSWDMANPSVFIVNDENITVGDMGGLTVSVVLGDLFAVRYSQTGTRISFYGSGVFINTSETNPTFTLTYSAGTVTATNGASTKNIADTAEIYGIVDKGAYVMKKSTEPAYLNSGSEVIADSEIYASGQTYNGNNNIWWHLEGTIENLDYPEVFNDTFTVTNKQVNGRYSTNYEDLYILDNIQFTVTASNSVVYNVTASYFAVPYEVTAEKSVHPDGPLTVILNVLPLLAIAGLVTGAVVWFINRKG